MSGLAIVRPASSDFWKARLDLQVRIWMFLPEQQCAWLLNSCWRVKMPFWLDVVCYLEPCPGNNIIVSFTLEAKLDSSKPLIQVHLEILSRFVKDMASHLWTKYIT